MTDISGYYIQERGWYKVGACRNQTVNDVWNECHHIATYRNVPDTLSLNRVFVVDMDSSNASILPGNLRLHAAHEHRNSYNVLVGGAPYFQNNHYGEILQQHWGGDISTNRFRVPVGLWIYIVDEPTTVIYVKAVGSVFKFYYSHMGNNESEISLNGNNRLVLEVNKQYTFRRDISDNGDHPFFLGDTDISTNPDTEGWQATASSNIVVTAAQRDAYVSASTTQGITTWQSVGLKIDPSFNDDPTNKLWYYCTYDSTMVFQFDVSGQAGQGGSATTDIKIGPDNAGLKFQYTRSTGVLELIESGSSYVYSLGFNGATAITQPLVTELQSVSRTFVHHSPGSVAYYSTGNNGSTTAVFGSTSLTLCSAPPTGSGLASMNTANIANEPRVWTISPAWNPSNTILETFRDGGGNVSSAGQTSGNSTLQFIFI